MEDKTLLQYIWHIRINRIILSTLFVGTLTALFLKWLVWENLIIYPFIFLSVMIPVQLIVASSIQYKFYQEWTEILKTYDRLQLRQNVKVYVKNFWLPAEMRNLKNLNRLSRTPFYQFDRADILESDDIVIVRGRLSSFSLFNSTTRPFAIPLTDDQKATK